MPTVKRKPRIYKKGKKLYVKIKGKFVQIKKKQVPKDLEFERPTKKVEQILLDQLKNQQQQYVVNFVKSKGRQPRIPVQKQEKQKQPIVTDNYEQLEGPNAKRKPFFNEKDKKNFLIGEIQRLEQLKADQFKQFQNQQDLKQISEHQQALKEEISKIDNQIQQNQNQQSQIQEIVDQINQKISNQPQKMYFPKYQEIQRVDPLLRYQQNFSFQDKRPIVEQSIQQTQAKSQQEIKKLEDDISQITENLNEDLKNKILFQTVNFIAQFKQGQIGYEQVVNITLQMINNELKQNLEQSFVSSQESLGYFKPDSELIPFENEDYKSESEFGGNGLGEKEGISNLDFDQIFRKNAFYYGCYTLTNLTEIIKKIDPETAYQIFIINPYEDKVLEKRPGHWIVLIINNDCCEICFYDCLAEPINDKIKQTIDKIMEKLESFHYYKFKHNLYRRQSLISDTCGFYVINFILSYLRDNDFQKASLLDLNIKQSEEYINQFKNLRFQDI